MPFVAGAMVAGSAASYFGGKSDAKKMRREMRAWRELQQQQLKFAKNQWSHYRNTYGDLEKMMVADAEQGVVGDYAGVTSRAAADAEGQFANQIDRQRRNMQAFGLDPSSGRYQSTDRQMGLDLAATKAQGINAAREGERRYARDATWQRRQSVGSMGAGLMRDAGQGVQQAMQSMGDMHAQNAGTYGSLSSNLFAQAGQMGMYGALQFGSHMAGTNQGGGSNYGHSISPGMPMGGSAFDAAVSDVAMAGNPGGGLQMADNWNFGGVNSPTNMGYDSNFNFSNTQY